MTNRVVQLWQYTATVMAVARFAPTWVRAFVASRDEQKAIQAFCFGPQTIRQVRTAKRWVRTFCGVEPAAFYTVAHEIFDSFQVTEADRKYIDEHFRFV